MKIILIAIAAIVVSGLLSIFISRRRRKSGRFKQAPFVNQWKQLQKYCSNKETWAKAIMASDELLNKALKKRRFKGKRMGERLVSAQHALSDNDGVWSSHNLSKKLKEGTNVRLREKQVKQALIHFRQALKDIGALPDDKR
ncbi:MAG: hypothetical protein JWS12_697 [Candidatus Saccharibacteria bacterium]|nr:hypothetical protein [Candidatus Saccharibacteria bacterium]